MATVERSLLVPYSGEQMYALVADLESYPSFLPSCRGARILKRDADRVCGQVDLDFKGIRQSFSTCNRMVPNQRIEMELLDGPFSHLSGGWRFQDLGRGDGPDRIQGCKVTLSLDYDFSNRMLRLALGPVFGLFANSLVDAFNQRAQQIYG